MNDAAASRLSASKKYGFIFDNDGSGSSLSLA
jgi:hypothetical protein